MVSGSVSSPLRGAFHLSLTVLVRYRSLNVFSLGEWSPQLPTRLLVSRGTQDTSPPSSTFLYGIVTLSDRSFQNVGVVVFSLLPVLQPQSFLTKKKGWFGLFPSRSPLLRESQLISSRRATEMFQFTRCPPSLPMCSAGGLQTSLWRGCPTRTLRVLRLQAAPPERFAGRRVLLRH